MGVVAKSEVVVARETQLPGKAVEQWVLVRTVQITLIRSVGAAESFLALFISKANKVSVSRSRALVQSNRQLAGVAAQESLVPTIGQDRT